MLHRVVFDRFLPGRVALLAVKRSILISRRWSIGPLPRTQLQLDTRHHSVAPTMHAPRGTTPLNRRAILTHRSLPTHHLQRRNWHSCARRRHQRTTLSPFALPGWAQNGRRLLSVDAAVWMTGPDGYHLRRQLSLCLFRKRAVVHSRTIRRISSGPNRIRSSS